MTAEAFITMRRFPAIVGMRDRRGAISLLVAVALPVLLGFAALAVDAGVWYLESTRLQLAADAAAMGAARLLGNNPTTSQLQQAALQAAEDASGGVLIGTLAEPVSVSATASAVTVTLTSASDGYFAGAIGAALPTLRATATAGQLAAPCILTTDSSIVDALQLDNAGSAIATGCSIFSNSTAPGIGNGTGGSCGSGISGAICVNSGTLSATSIGATGGVVQSNSGSNSISPAPSSNAGSEADPFAHETAPTPPGTCSYTNASFTAWQSTPYHFTQSKNVFCGNTTIGGNGTSDQFDPGIYYVVGGSLTFNNANVTEANGVTFVLTANASYPHTGGFVWTNYSGNYAMSAPTSGPTAGILVWQVPPSGGCSLSAPSNPMNDFEGGSTLTLQGAFYAPCGEVKLGNDAKLAAASGAAMSVIAQQIVITGSGQIAAAGSAGTGGVIALLQ